MIFCKNDGRDTIRGNKNTRKYLRWNLILARDNNVYQGRAKEGGKFHIPQEKATPVDSTEAKLKILKKFLNLRNTLIFKT